MCEQMIGYGMAPLFGHPHRHHAYVGRVDIHKCST